MDEAAKIVAQMSLEDKIALCSGLDNWHTKGFEVYGIPSVMVSDGPHGLRKQPDEADMLGLNESVPATCFPSASILACSWDEELVGEVAGAITDEAGANGVAMVLGPGVNIKRNPLCGRNFEYFSEDPCLAGILGAAYVRGAQAKSIGSCVKHFACNNQECYRMASNSIVDERTLRELYLAPFERVVRDASPAAVMCSYNLINGTYSSENHWLLTEVLRDAWGYEGMVVTDWGAIGERDESFRAGCDLAMPGGSAYREREAAECVRSGTLDEHCVDMSAERVVRFARLGQRALKGDFTYTEDEHHALAKRAAEKSAVLLKNEDGALPLAAGERVCFVGRMAKQPRYQGSGSSHINPTQLRSLCDLRPDIPYAPGYDEQGQTSDELVAEAVACARASDVVVVFVGLTESYESEGLDRDNMRMPEGHLRLIDELAAASSRVVVVLFGGGAMETPWADKVSAILYMGLAGQAEAEATLSLLFGDVSPSGKLAESWPYVYEDCPSSGFYSHGRRDAEYREGFFVGYRYYDSAGVPVRWPFGYGLSYTSFTCSDLRMVGAMARVTATNTGARAGEEVVQLYIGKADSAFIRPRRELKAFKKVVLEPGESADICFALKSDDFRVWDERWVTEEGAYQIYVGDHLGDDMLTVTYVFCADDFGEGAPESMQLSASSRYAVGRQSWYCSLTGSPTRADLELMCGHAICDREPETTFTVTSTLSDAMQGSAILRLAYRLIEWWAARTDGRDSVQYKMTMAVINEVTLRAAQNAGGIGGHLADALVLIANGHFFKGVRKLLER